MEFPPDEIIELYKALYPNVFALLKRDNATDRTEELIWLGIEIFWEKCQDLDFSIIGSPAAYIYKICKNKWIDEKKRSELNLNIDDLPIIPDELDSPSEEKLVELMEQCLKVMNETCQKLLNLLRETSDLKEIAKRLDITYENVRYRKSVCIAALRKCIKTITF